MHKLFRSIQKELLLLKRDFGGLVILFVMPLVLIVTITLIQDGAFKSVGNTKMKVLLIDNDHNKIAQLVQENFKKSGAFEVITMIGNQPITEELAKSEVFKGKFPLAIVIPAHLSSDLEKTVQNNVTQIMAKLGVTESDSTATKSVIKGKEIKLYFDPATQISFKNGVKNAIDKLIVELENKAIYDSFASELGEGEALDFQNKNYISFKEIVPIVNNKEQIPNSVQHNVPAWTLFAIFFIVVPLSINIVKEKSQGTFVRLITNPVPFSVLIFGKTITYLLICLIQFWLMLAVGIFLFPYLGLPSLDVTNKLILLNVVAFFAGLAAVGLGVLLGTIANTQEQSAPFGATSVVILAAIGGVWVPVFAMPKVMQVISNISPMNWGLNAFYDILLRNGSLFDIAFELLLLTLFFILTIFISIIYDKRKRAV